MKTDSSRKAAFEALTEIENEKAYSNLAVSRALSENPGASPGFTRELVYGTLKNRTLIDHRLNAFVRSGIDKVRPREKCLLRMGMFQLDFMGSVPPYAAINETVNLARRVCRGREGFINGVLRSCAGAKGNYPPLPPRSVSDAGYLSVKYSFAPWIAELWLGEYGEEKAEAMMAACNERPELTIRVNTMRTSPAALAERLKAQGFQVQELPAAAPLHAAGRMLAVSGENLLASREYAQGLFSVQDIASFEACAVLAPRPDETVIDVCGAPGGKTCAICELMENRGRVICCDVYEHKLRLASSQAQRLGADIAEFIKLDGRTGDAELNETADRVLVDAPCSGLGVARRKPEIKYREKEGLAELIELQRQILDRAALYVKKGGVLVYSTCTVDPAENEEQTERFLKEHGDYQLEEQKQLLPDGGTDGFYICRMTRKNR